MRILGIETSCDETAASVVENGRTVLSNVIYSQIDKHKKWGGVIPELASRLHMQAINEVINKTLIEAFGDTKDAFKQIDAIAVTNGPGLIGSLLVGVNVAKALAWLHKKPLLSINHLHAHLCANYLDTDLEPPFVCLLASGGHTQVIKSESYTHMEILGETIDDAAGEAFDKVARLMDLPYPGGPHLDKLAQTATDLKKYSFPVSRVGEYDFSFSGLKTAVLRLKQKISEVEWEENKANIAYAFQDCVARTFVKKIKKAIEANQDIKQIVIAGGVAANSRIRGLFLEEFKEQKLVFPSLKYCTDNAAMVAAAGYFVALEKGFDESQELADFNKYDLEVFSRV